MELVFLKKKKRGKTTPKEKKGWCFGGGRRGFFAGPQEGAVKKKAPTEREKNFKPDFFPI
ncbi:hypothetical protein [Candidatus Amarolinea dominans]|uniref:hypothetical protein n=1 Tax=Candidatus Amarolinea dominans TaxID=3140696 RepID=UPI00313737D9|nr:hypothetical protein [Anaerolineae bacterium]